MGSKRSHAKLRMPFHSVAKLMYGSSLRSDSSRKETRVNADNFTHHRTHINFHVPTDEDDMAQYVRCLKRLILTAI